MRSKPKEWPIGITSSARLIIPTNGGFCQWLHATSNIHLFDSSAPTRDVAGEERSSGCDDWLTPTRVKLKGCIERGMGGHDNRVNLCREIVEGFFGRSSLMSS